MAALREDWGIQGRLEGDLEGGGMQGRLGVTRGEGGWRDIQERWGRNQGEGDGGIWGRLRETGEGGGGI